MKTKSYMFLFLLASSFFADPLNAQDEIFLYGKVSTVDDRTYEGAIRWGKEEVYWVDIFNASKQRNDNLQYLTDRERERLDDRQRNTSYSWGDRASRWFVGNWESHGNRDYVHQFACQFGDIAVLRPTGKQYVEVEFRDGRKIEVNGEGYNDVGNDVRVMDKELGEVIIRWNRISKIQFMKTPPSIPSKFGEPLYGTVQAYGKKVSGFIQWDHDERLSTDKLDGESSDGKLAIEFGKIRSIEKSGGRSIVILKSGREVVMGNSNDVGRGHRGVIVMNREFPSFDIPWSEFEKITFEEQPKGGLPSYSEFSSPKPLQGKVKTSDGKSLSGRIVYDLDEQYDFELLQGKEGDFEYTIPFRDIKQITTKNRNRCVVTLKNGKTVTLDDAQDVGERNQGIVVLREGKDQSVYIPWSDVSEIDF